MLAQRIMTAVVLLALIVPSIFFAPIWIWGLVSLLMLCTAGFEWGRLMGSAREGALLGGLLAILGAAYITWRGEAPMPPPPALVAVLCAASLAFWFSIGPMSLLRVHRVGPGWGIGALVLSACWVALYELRIESSTVLVSAMAIVWLADIGAYFSGRKLGRHKLAPRVSPGKTWEGVAGGIVAVLAAAAVVAQWFPHAADAIFSSHLASHLGWFITALVLAAIAAISVVGDLYESLLKRIAGVKDSGRTLPGHGGVLDRIDALIPTMPGCLLLLQLLR